MIDEHIQFQNAIDHLQRDELSQAQGLLQKVLSQNPSHTGALVSYVQCLEKQGKRAESLPLMALLNSLHPENSEFLFAYTSALLEADRGSEAILPLRTALTCQETPELLVHLANAYFTEQDLLNAKAFSHWALSLNLKYAPGLELIAKIEFKSQKFDTAIVYYQRYLKSNPKDLRSQLRLGDCYEKINRPEKALKCFELVRDQEPLNSDLWALTGRLYLLMSQREKAIAALNQALTFNSQNGKALYHLGNAYSEQGLYEQALVYFEKAVLMSPEFANAQYTLALCHLSLGRQNIGFERYGWRWRLAHYVDDIIPLSIPIWQGDVSIDHLLVWTEQGVGDGLFFAQALFAFSQIKPASLEVTFACDPRLKAIFARSLPGIRVISYHQQVISQLLEKQRGTNTTQCQTTQCQTTQCQTTQCQTTQCQQIAVGDLLCHLWKSHKLPDFPQAMSIVKNQNLQLFQPYLVPDPKIAKILYQRQAQAAQAGGNNQTPARVRIGLAWHSTATPDGAERSIALAQFASLIQAYPEFYWVSLQYGDHSQDVVHLNQSLNNEALLEVDSEINCFNDLESLHAQISTLDLVITIDNSTVHMAGCLGVPTWLLLGPVHNWRWPLTGEQTFWYPSVRIKRWRSGAVKDELMNDLRVGLKQLKAT